MKKLGFLLQIVSLVILLNDQVRAQAQAPEEEVGQFDKRKDKNEKILQEEKEDRARQFDNIVDQLESNRTERDELEKKLAESRSKNDEDAISDLKKKLEENKEKGSEIEKKIMSLSE